MNRRVFVLLLAISLAILGTVAVFVYVRSADARAVAGKAPLTVLVAEERIPAGTSGKALSSGNRVRTVVMPAATVPDDALDRIDEDLMNLVVTAEVQRGQLLLRAAFGARALTPGGVAIPDGMVAATATVRVGTFGLGSVRSGSRVGILYTYTPLDGAHRDSASGKGLEKERGLNVVTRLLVTNVEVLAVGPGPDGAVSGGQGGAARDAGRDTLPVTFALTQLDAQRLAHAAALGGELNCVLLGDATDVRPDSGIDNNTLFSQGAL